MHITPFKLIDPDGDRSIFSGKGTCALIERLLSLRDERPKLIVRIVFTDEDNLSTNAEGGTAEQSATYLTILGSQTEVDPDPQAEFIRQLLLKQAESPEDLRSICERVRDLYPVDEVNVLVAEE